MIVYSIVRVTDCVDKKESLADLTSLFVLLMRLTLLFVWYVRQNNQEESTYFATDVPAR